MAESTLDFEADRLAAHGWTLEERSRFDPTDPDALSTVIVYAVASVLDADPVDPEALPPLYSVLDSDALERVLFGVEPTDDDVPPHYVGFHYAGCYVTVRGDGVAQVYRRDEEP